MYICVGLTAFQVAGGCVALGQTKPFRQPWCVNNPRHELRLRSVSCSASRALLPTQCDLLGVSSGFMKENYRKWNAFVNRASWPELLEDCWGLIQPSGPSQHLWNRSHSRLEAHTKIELMNPVYLVCWARAAFLVLHAQSLPLYRVGT